MPQIYYFNRYFSIGKIRKKPHIALFMKIKLITTGKTRELYLLEGLNIYLNRLKHYASIEYIELGDVKNTGNIDDIKTKENEQILKHISVSGHVILLDERGKEMSSIQFADFINQKQCSGIKNIIFIIGGAYGFTDKIWQRANHTISLSKMTFTHQMVRLIFLEQLYRAFTILKGEKYHH